MAFFAEAGMDLFGSAIEDSAAAGVEDASAEAAENAAADSAEQEAAGNVGAADNIGKEGSKATGWALDKKKIGLALGAGGVVGVMELAPHLMGDVIHHVSKDIGGIFGAIAKGAGSGVCEGLGAPKFVCDNALYIALGCGVLWIWHEV